MTKYQLIIEIVAVVAVAAMEIYALHTHTDGVALAAAVGAVSTLVGVHIPTPTNNN